MPETKYADLISRNITKTSLHREVKGPKIEFGGASLSGGSDLDISWYCPSQPVPISDKIHTHEFDEYLCFLPANPLDLIDYQAEIEFSLGAEPEKRLLTEPCIIYLPRGLPHGGLNFKKIDKPVSYMKICLSSRFSAFLNEFEKDFSRYIVGPHIRQDVLKVCFFVNDNMVGTEIKNLPSLSFNSGELTGARLKLRWSYIKEPLTIFLDAHPHPEKRYFLFMGGNPLHVDDFDAEVAVSLGEEAETHIIDSTAMLHIDQGIIIRKICFVRIVKPVMIVEFALS